MTNAELARVMGLKLSELNQLQSYVRQCEEEGWYYGSEKNFRQRHEAIKTALNMNDEDASDDNT